MDPLAPWLLIACLVVILVLSSRLRKVEQRVAQLYLVDKKLEFLLKQSPVAFDPYDGLPLEVTQALTGATNKIDATRRYRRLKPVSLAVAKRDIELGMDKSGIVF